MRSEHMFTEYLASAVYGRVEQDPKLIPSPLPGQLSGWESASRPVRFAIRGPNRIVPLLCR